MRISRANGAANRPANDDGNTYPVPELRGPTVGQAVSALWSVIARILLWPRQETLKADIGCIGGLGRAIHWVGAALASNILVIGIFGSLFDPEIDAAQTLTFCAVVALILYLPARGLRRLMAGE